jgi:8-amino-7-oxononanoate synthase
MEEELNKALQQRKSVNALRQLSVENDLIDFCSNDYLGFARDGELKIQIKESNLSGYQNFIGSTGSRLLTGNSTFLEELEQQIATFHNAESGLIFNSGYDANIGLFSSIAKRGDTIIYDELVHASIRDGIRLSHAHSFSFAHNDLNSLKDKLQKARGQVVVAVESIYSMDGDAAPLQELAVLCKQYNASIVVDEAHAAGIFGKTGEGLVSELGLEEAVFARVITFGKALGCHGAAVLGSQVLRSYLINFSRSFIYTTAMPVHSQISIKNSYDKMSESENIVLKFSHLVNLFKQKVELLDLNGYIESKSAVHCILIPGNDRVKEVANYVQSKGFDVRPILSPTVPEGKERIRICLHLFNTESEIDGMLKAVKEKQ